MAENESIFPAIRGALVQTLVSNIIMLAILFAAAGTVTWPEAWIFVALLDVCGLALGIWLARKDPALLTERMKSPVAAGDQRPRDRRIMIAILVVFAVWLILIGLDARRFGWSHVPVWGQVIGVLLVFVAYWGWYDVLRANTFASTRIKLQADRGQKVISTGPYAIVRHPMYSYVIPMMIGASLLLGSLWGLLGVAFSVPLMAARALGEEDLLLEGLPGYRDYAAKVRYRLVPGVW